MGYALQRFVAKPDENLLCGICKGVMQDAVLTRCGHAFCQACLDTWLARPLTGSCPQCRASVSKFQVSPVWALRELVSGLTVGCDHAERGCRLVMRLDSLAGHRGSCAYGPVECAGCRVVVSRHDLARHQSGCAKIAATADEPDPDAPTPTGGGTGNWPDRLVGELQDRLARTERQLEDTRKRLESSESGARQLGRDLSEARLQLHRRKQGECTSSRGGAAAHLLGRLGLGTGTLQPAGPLPETADPQYPYGFEPESIARLSLLIACHLLAKPEAVDRNRVFDCVKRCYDGFARCGSRYEQDVHMLVATAYASNWFTENQRINFHCWLQSIARYRKYADLVCGPPLALRPVCTPGIVRRTTFLPLRS